MNFYQGNLGGTTGVVFVSRPNTGRDFIFLDPNLINQLDNFNFRSIKEIRC